MSNFDFAVKHTLELEGVFSDHPKDPGGKTKFGISERIWNAYWEDAFPNLQRPRIEDISIAQAIEAYRECFWYGVRLDRLNDRHVAAEIFDSGVNCGPANGVKFTQAACNYLRVASDGPIKVDGILGPVTRSTIQCVIKAGLRLELLKAANCEQYIYYKAIGNQHMSRGWLKRIQLAEAELLSH